MIPPCEFQFGQQVYLVEGSAYGQKYEPCSICFGKLFVTLVLGNGEQQAIECEACEHGYGGPTGRMVVRDTWSKVISATVTGLSFDGQKWQVECDHNRSEHIFTNAEDAEAYRAALHAELEQQAERWREEALTAKKRHLTRSAQYHRGKIKEAKSTIAWHESRLAALRVQKTNEKEATA